MKNQIVLDEAVRAIFEKNAGLICVNQGEGVQIPFNQGTINIISDNPKEKSRKYEWLSLSREYYCLFVLDNEIYNDGVFSIPKSISLEECTTSEIREEFKTLNHSNIEAIRKMPCIFAEKNKSPQTAMGNQQAKVGRITNVVIQEDFIKFYFDIFLVFPQQCINQNISLFNLKTASMRNELDMEHWAIKLCDMIETLSKLNIDIQ